MLFRALICLSFLGGPLFAADHPPLITAIDSIGITVSDLDRAVDFYSKVLSFEKVSERENDGPEYEHLEGVFGLHTRSARMRLGGEFIELTEFLAPRGLPVPVDTKPNDGWFQHIAIITSDMDRAYKLLRENKVQHASSSPQLLPDWNQNAAGIRAFYFRDPDGHFLEILQFPPDKGPSKWHERGDKLFLGIDHTAIVIKSTEASLRFYGEVLGLQVAGESENYGTEQEHLNNVFGARLHITSMRAAAGPGVEFLEYLAPRDGRNYPADEKANDLIHWQIRFVGSAVAEAAAELRKARSAFISPGVVELSGKNREFQASIVVRDPDGHAIQLVQP